MQNHHITQFVLPCSYIVHVLLTGTVGCVCPGWLPSPCSSRIFPVKWSSPCPLPLNLGGPQWLLSQHQSDFRGKVIKMTDAATLFSSKPTTVLGRSPDMEKNQEPRPHLTCEGKVNICYCLKPLNLGMACYTAMRN